MHRSTTELGRSRRSRGAVRAWISPAALLLAMGCGSNKSSDPSGASGSAGAGSTQATTGGSDGTGPFACPGDAAESALIPVPGETFIMGCNAAVDANCAPDELPMRSVTLSPFQIERTEVTQGRYAACIAEQKCAAPSCAWNCDESGNPATCITWGQAKAYCAWAGRRLPTEAEWEFAARGSDGRKYPWGNNEPDCNFANFAGCAGKVEAVGQHPDGASPFGAVDMSGNVVEMVADWYDMSYYQTAPNTDPKGPPTGTKYGGRGGGFKSEAVWQRASARDWYDVPDSGASLGFRCAL